MASLPDNLLSAGSHSNIYVSLCDHP